MGSILDFYPTDPKWNAHPSINPLAAVNRGFYASTIWYLPFTKLMGVPVVTIMMNNHAGFEYICIYNYIHHIIYL